MAKKIRFTLINQLFNEAIANLLIPCQNVVARYVTTCDLSDCVCYECFVTLSKGTSLRRYDIESFEFAFNSDPLLKHLGAWIDFSDKGLQMRIKILDYSEHGNE